LLAKYIDINLKLNYNQFRNLEIYSARMMNWGETANSSAEGEAATNSQAKGPNSDETLESLMTPKKQSFT
jgi:hypothetical protein